MLILLIVYGAELAVMSLITFILFLRDKKLAKAGNIRIKEKALLGATAFGGGLGALVGSNVARHKTDKAYFSVVIYSSAILQLALLVFIAILAVM